MGQDNLWQRFLDWLNSLFVTSPAPTPPTPPQPTRNPEPPGPPPQPVERSVLLIVFNPHIPSEGGKPLLEVMGWNSPALLAQSYAAHLQDSSAGFARFSIEQTVEVDDIPVKADGYQYTPDELLSVLHNHGAGAHNPDLANYEQILLDFNIPEMVDAGQVDEVWMFAFPYGGFYESRMAGPGAFFCNAPPLSGAGTGTRRYVIMGFNPERGIGEMLESFGHRCEDTLRRVYRSKTGEANLFERFCRYDQKYPGAAEVGTIHFAPNSQADYDWGNPHPVPSRCDTWLNFPDLGGAARTVTCADWGYGDIRLHHSWWLRHLPHVSGETGGIRNNWWGYIIDPELVE
jgi:hypothetical protein